MTFYRLTGNILCFIKRKKWETMFVIAYSLSTTAPPSFLTSTHSSIHLLIQ